MLRLFLDFQCVNVSVIGCLLSTYLFQAQAATLSVGPNQAYTSIQSAITAAQSGDVLEVEAGTYARILALGTKELTIIGMSGFTKYHYSISPQGFQAFR